MENPDRNPNLYYVHSEDPLTVEIFSSLMDTEQKEYRLTHRNLT